MRRALLFALLFVATALAIIQQASPVGIDEDSDDNIKRVNAGHSMQIGIPLEEALERIRSMPHRRNELIRSLGVTSLTQRAGRNLILRVLLTIGKYYFSEPFAYKPRSQPLIEPVIVEW